MCGRRISMFDDRLREISEEGASTRRMAQDTERDLERVAFTTGAIGNAAAKALLGVVGEIFGEPLGALCPH